MKRIFLSVAVMVLALSQAASMALALTLESIGASEVGGRSISSWYYQGTNPAFTGTADPSASVTVDINGTSGTATADSSGNWTFQPTALSAIGTYPVTISSGTDNLAFSLDITALGSSGSATASSSGSLTMPDELPETGSFEQTLLLMGSGLGLVLAGVLFYWKLVPKLLFEDSSSDEDEE